MMYKTKRIGIDLDCYTSKTKFNKLIKIMMDEDIERWTKFKNGEVFPWDVLSSIDESKTINRLTK